MPAAKVSPELPVLGRASLPRSPSPRRTETAVSDVTSTESSVSSFSTVTSTGRPCAPLSPGASVYERSLHAAQFNERWLKEITMGKRVGFYKFRNELGNGNFSQVKLALHQLTKERVAVKIIDKSKLDQKTQRMLEREIESMEGLRHPNVIRLYEVVHTLSKIHLVMEYACGGELFAKITNEGRMLENDAKHIFAQVVAAVDHMHQLNIIHRDLKAENVFYSGPRTVKVGDFGFSIQVQKPNQLLNTFCGSPPYAAPELFKDESYDGAPVDVWALGILLYFMVTAAMPFRAQTVVSLKKLILTGDFTIPPTLTPECSALIGDILKQLPKERLTIQQIMECEWLKGQTFPKALEDDHSRPSADIALASAQELETRRRMTELGIGADLLQASADKGSRNPIIGTYRMLLHRIQREATEETEAEEDVLSTDESRGVIITSRISSKSRWDGWLTRSNTITTSPKNHGLVQSGKNYSSKFVRPFHFLRKIGSSKSQNNNNNKALSNKVCNSNCSNSSKVSCGCTRNSKLCTIL